MATTTELEPTYFATATPLFEPIYDAAPRAERSAWPVRVGVLALSGAEWGFGVLSLFVGLAMLAAVPVLQFLSLGYLLEASGRISRSGRLRDGALGVRPAARVGGVVLGCWVWFWPGQTWDHNVQLYEINRDLPDIFGITSQPWKGIDAGLGANRHRCCPPCA